MILYTFLRELEEVDFILVKSFSTARFRTAFSRCTINFHGSTNQTLAFPRCTVDFRSSTNQTLILCTPYVILFKSKQYISQPNGVVIYAYPKSAWLRRNSKSNNQGPNKLTHTSKKKANSSIPLRACLDLML